MRNAITNPYTYSYANCNPAAYSDAQDQSNTACSPYPTSSPVRR